MKKTTKCFVGLALSLLLGISSTIPSLATTVITDKEIESNDNPGDENICSIGHNYRAYINVPGDIDLFMIFPDKTQTMHCNLIKGHHNSDQVLYIWIYDDITGEHVKPLFALEENENYVQFDFEVEQGHNYIMLVNSDTVSYASYAPYGFQFYY